MENRASFPLAVCVEGRGGVPEWPKGPDCKSDGSAFVGSNPTPSTKTILFRWFYRDCFGVVVEILEVGARNI